MRLIFTRLILLILSVSIFAQVREHVVQDNQTLYSIARMYNTTVSNLMAWNNLSSNRIRPGQRLVVAPRETEQTAFVSPGIYIVQTGDTLELVANKFGLRPDDLARLNALESSRLVPGTKLLLRPASTPVHTVQQGETLQRISQIYGIGLDDLMAINSLNSSQLRAGQILRVRLPESIPLTHEVLEMDSVPSLARLYNISEEDIRALNGLEGDRLIPGQVVRLQDFQTANMPLLQPLGPEQVNRRTPTSDPPPMQQLPSVPQLPGLRFHKVESGDTLFSLARRYGVKVDDLMNWNKLENTNIRVGSILRVQAPEDAPGPSLESNLANPVRPQTETAPAETPLSPSGHLSRLIDIRPPRDDEQLRWDRFVVLKDDIPLFEWQNDFYYFSHPGQLTQPSNRYYEEEWRSPLRAYRKATRLWSEFTALVNARPKKSDLLQGVTIVLDPGHGGLDPGTIVRSTDGSGEPLYITEDEYVYDIALRMVPLLVEHGARVEMTVLAPNHLIRDTTPATRTLIHEKNEVYNNEAMNATDQVSDWVMGGAAGLNKRLQIANGFFDKHGGTRVFLSLHAENNPRAPMGMGLWLHPDDASSRPLAQAMLPFLGQRAYTRDQRYAVLSNQNKADFKILAEVRNLAYQEHAWALRFANTRQLDAERLVRGLLNFFQERRKRS